MDVIREICDKSLHTVSWVVSSIKNYRVQLIKCYEKIEQAEGWDDITIREASGSKMLFRN